MPATKARPEYRAALLVAGMLSALIFFGGIGNGNAPIYAAWTLTGFDLIRKTKKTGCINPYKKGLDPGNTDQWRFMLAILMWTAGIMYLTARCWLPTIKGLLS